jgi:glutathione S-transferase
VIDLYTWPAPNGHKAQILVEELGIPYRVVPIDITRGDQHEPSYRAVNPNGKIPAIVDHAPLDGGAPVTVFESGAVMLYPAEKEKRFLPDWQHQLGTCCRPTDVGCGAACRRRDCRSARARMGTRCRTAAAVARCASALKPVTACPVGLGAVGLNGVIG